MILIFDQDQTVARCAKDGESACAGSACAMPFRLRRKSWTSKRDTAGSSASATIIIATTTEESYVEVHFIIDIHFTR